MYFKILKAQSQVKKQNLNAFLLIVSSLSSFICGLYNALVVQTSVQKF